MKVVLFNAVTLDGFIATSDGGTDWVKDLDDWEKAVEEFGAVIIGRRTHDEVGNVGKATSFVYTHSPEKHEGNQQTVFGSDPKEILQAVKAQGYEKVILGGGAETNAAFAAAGCIDEMILDIHPLLLGKGIRLLGSFAGNIELKLLSSRQLSNGLVQNHYRVIK